MSKSNLSFPLDFIVTKEVSLISSVQLIIPSNLLVDGLPPTCNHPIRGAFDNWVTDRIYEEAHRLDGWEACEDVLARDWETKYV